MTKLFAMAIPILAGKTEQWKKFSNELKTTYRKEFFASRKALGVQERTFFQSTPMGDMIIVTLQGEDPQGAFEKFGQKTDEFSKWFASQAIEIHGMDITKKPSGKLPELVVETEAIEETVHLLK
ncbi:MAG: hypothetical protein V4547_09530 [Bacteroidota bacterium]